MPETIANIAPNTHDVRITGGIGWRTTKGVDHAAGTVTVNGRVEDETYPLAWVADVMRRKHPAR